MSDKEREATEYPVKAMHFLEAWAHTMVTHTPEEMNKWWEEWVEEMKNDN